MSLYKIIKESEMTEIEKKKLRRLHLELRDLEKIAIEKYINSCEWETVIEALHDDDKQEYYKIKNKLDDFYGKSRNPT